MDNLDLSRVRFASGQESMDEDPPVGQWDLEVEPALLNYPLDDSHARRCRAYDVKPQELNEADLQAEMPVKAMCVRASLNCLTLQPTFSFADSASGTVLSTTILITPNSS